MPSWGPVVKVRTLAEGVGRQPVPREIVSATIAAAALEATSHDARTCVTMQESSHDASVYSGPDLVENHGHHEQEINAQSQEDENFDPLERTSGNVPLFRLGELVALK
jgi:hypothetical protein